MKSMVIALIYMILAIKGYSVEDVNLLAELIYWENWYTDAEKETAYWTGAVVMNRVASPEFPNTIKEVIYQTKPCKQYAVTGKFFTKELPEECYEMARNILLKGTDDVPKNSLAIARSRQIIKKDWVTMREE